MYFDFLLNFRVYGHCVTVQFITRASSLTRLEPFCKFVSVTSVVEFKCLPYHCTRFGTFFFLLLNSVVVVVVRVVNLHTTHWKAEKLSNLLLWTTTTTAITAVTITATTRGEWVSFLKGTVSNTDLFSCTASRLDPILRYCTTLLHDRQMPRGLNLICPASATGAGRLHSLRMADSNGQSTSYRRCSCTRVFVQETNRRTRETRRSI